MKCRTLKLPVTPNTTSGYGISKDMFLLILITAGITLAKPEATREATVLEASEIKPVVLIKAQAGQRFTVVVDGQPHTVIGGEADLSLTTLTLGPHTVEVRSENNLVIWSHGTLNLIAGDEVLLSLEEGRSVTVRGREDAWQNTTSERPQPRKKPLPNPDTDL